jgi:hypothetical protein
MWFVDLNLTKKMAKCCQSANSLEIPAIHNPHVKHCIKYLLGHAGPTSHWTGLSEQLLDMAVRQEVGLACPSRSFCLSTARTSQFENLSDSYVQELLGQTGLMTSWTGMSKQLAEAVKRKPGQLSFIQFWDDHLPFFQKSNLSSLV